MISARWVLFAVFVIKYIYEYALDDLRDKQNKKPLPESVSDVYDAERYRTYLDSIKDDRRLGYYSDINEFIVEAFICFSPFYKWIEQISGGNPYYIVLLGYLFVSIESFLVETPLDYYETFVIDEKYGLNRKDLKEFIKDKVLSMTMIKSMTVVLCVGLVYIGEHMAAWTNGFAIGFAGAFKITLFILGMVLIFGIVFSLLSLVFLRLTYKFTPLEEGELRDKILGLMDGSKKKVKKINVYNESKKSNSKNAFLLKILCYREFGIADNFIIENAEDELLAVLSHEIGHLKHKKGWREYIGRGFTVLTLLYFTFLIANPGVMLWVNGWIRNSFGLEVNNYVLIMGVYVWFYEPLAFVSGLYSKWLSRRNEYEADREAVKNGYGEALIKTFKEVSNDELLTVNPHPFIEFTEYDHPGMANRISAIRRAEQEIGQLG